MQIGDLVRSRLSTSSTSSIVLGVIVKEAGGEGSSRRVWVAWNDTSILEWEACKWLEVVNVASR